LILAPFFLQSLQFPRALSALLLLFPVFLENSKAAEEGGSGHSDSTTVSLLFCLLLLLLLLLFLAWRRLSRDSQGRYHPRRLIGVLIHQWQAFRGELPPEELPQGYQEDEEQRVEELEEPEQQEDMAAEKQQQKDKQEEEEEQQQQRQEELNKSIHSEPPEEAEPQQPSKEEGTKAAEGSAEALLSDLHSFSGTAAWEDSGKHFHITTL
ncbi:PREDICTED: protein tyrosine phosphatase receptor type C-associated protein, partial [Gekko japonicus]|uniref:Protein tyrosine phosphatase receptor type C-associated protein n=1 Tax=Gekko japonicus TaxID=146911 RepID=A0ABM1L125_GEKJA